MKITIDQSKCVTAGLCVIEAGMVFDQDPETGVVVLLDESPDGENAVAAREAAQMCPALAITVQEDGAN
jgi:ferredoxin